MKKADMILILLLIFGVVLLIFFYKNCTLAYRKKFGEARD